MSGEMEDLSLTGSCEAVGFSYARYVSSGIQPGNFEDGSPLTTGGDDVDEEDLPLSIDGEDDEVFWRLRWGSVVPCEGSAIPH